MVLAPKPLLSGAVPLEAFLTTLQKVCADISFLPDTFSLFNILISSCRALLGFF